MSSNISRKLILNTLLHLNLREELQSVCSTTFTKTLFTKATYIYFAIYMVLNMFKKIKLNVQVYDECTLEDVTEILYFIIQFQCIYIVLEPK